MDIANLTTYGCFGGGGMYKLNNSADLSKVQRYVKFEDVVEASLNSPASPAQHAQPAIAELFDQYLEDCDVSQNEQQAIQYFVEYVQQQQASAQ